MEQAGVVILIVFIASIVIAFTFARYAKAASLLDDWARDNGYVLIDSQRKALFRGPFFFTTSKSQLVYRIIVEDAQGQRREGYARVGGYFIGLLADRVDVRWDD